MGRMRLLFVTPSDKVGGGNRVMFSLAAELAGRHQVELAFPANRSHPKISPAASVRATATGRALPTRAGFLLNHLSLVAWVRRNRSRFDAIISSGQTTGILLPLVAHPALYNYIQADEFAISREGPLAAHAWLDRVYARMMHRSLQHRSIRHLFNSRFSYRTFSSAPGLSGRPPLIVPCGVDASVFRPAHRPPDPRPVTIASTVRVQRWKGLHLLLAAYRLLSPQQRLATSWHLITPDDLQDFDIPPGFQVHHPRDDAQMVPLLQQADIFLSTSLWEGFGLPALEAMACGCAVITSRNGGCREYADHGANCLTYPPDDPAMLARHIASLISDRRLRDHLAGNGLLTAAGFTWAAAAARLLAALADRGSPSRGLPPGGRR